MAFLGYTSTSLGLSVCACNCTVLVLDARHPASSSHRMSDSMDGTLNLGHGNASDGNGPWSQRSPSPPHRLSIPYECLFCVAMLFSGYVMQSM
ncbi:hypothetical protein GGI42DRAFT_7144 [Trichoderma sp. SZMC 28013]